MILLVTRYLNFILIFNSAVGVGGRDLVDVT